jgi:hypothetical protein
MSDIKEKAKQLVDEFLGFELDDYDDPEMIQQLGNAKQCALICVNETIQALQNHAWQNRHIISQYETVKKEIEKL